MKNLKDMLARREGLVALEVGTDSAHVALIGASGSELAAWRDLPGIGEGGADSAKCRDALAQWAREQGAEGLPCRIALGGAFFQVDTATLPAMNEEELASSAHYEAMDRFSIEEGRSVIQHVVLGTAAGRCTVALLAAPADQVRRVADMVMQAGLLPMSIENSALSAARGALRWERSMSGQLVAALHIEPTVATVSLWRDGNLAALRRIDGNWGCEAQAPGSAEVSADADTIALEPVTAECGWRWSALAEETLRTLRQACGDGVWPSCLAVSGTAATHGELIRAVGGVCGMQTLAVECDAWIHHGASRVDASWAASLGVGAMTETGVASLRRAA